jgi:hypothetical protein
MATSTTPPASPAETPAAKAPAKPKPTAKAPAQAVAKAPARAVSRPTAAKRLADAKLAALAENHTPSEAAAHAVIREFSDLEPSVNRIMSADLNEAGKLHAVALFRASLGVAGDPNRMPINAIEASRKINGSAEA